MNENSNNNRERKTIDDTPEKNDFTISDLNPLKSPDKETNEELSLFSSSLTSYTVDYEPDFTHLYVSIQVENGLGISDREEVIFVLGNGTSKPVPEPSVDIVAQTSDPVSINLLILCISMIILLAVIVDLLCLILIRKGCIYTFLTKTKLCRKLVGKNKKRCRGGSRRGRYFQKDSKDFV
ncbi:uncharacterized protein LOC111708070 [Eurytemora carolleeae]|uniref:uncharacterized protein LOC111708070 n=1 Tax=Eurytemora carolleeae TaxID=1294199 RepID=UPI000C758BA3|nr:uncharacterized protein LOC111708070 [Eurytemora carolleeae]|eukprot:XP_023337089.1 uncharacterized protein LOC111708070 [Eurytemora affinis]